jgi:very-short-patch-repair endonuclease
MTAWRSMKRSLTGSATCLRPDLARVSTCAGENGRCWRLMRVMREKVASDKMVAKIAERQHGVVSARQLYRAGVSKDAVRWRVEAGRLHRLHQGVYAVGHRAIPFQGRCMAAVLACGGGPGVKEGRANGPISGDGKTITAARSGGRSTVVGYWGAAVSHRSAASLWELLAPIEGPVDVFLPGDAGRKARRGIRIHRSRSLLPAAVTLRSGVPVTTPRRTISDLERTVAGDGRQGSISPRELRRAIRQANVLGLPIGDELGRDRSRSDLERDFLALCRRHRLPPPEVNVPIGPHLVDFLWRERRLIVETDGYVYHRGRAAFEDDRERDLRLRKLGFDVVRVSEKQVDEDPDTVAEVVGAALRVGADGEQGP